MAPDNSPTQPKLQALFVRYIGAILIISLALYLRYLFIPLLGLENPYHTVWVAIVVSAWYFGLGPSMLAILVGVLGVWYCFLPPLHTFGRPSTADLYGMISFAVVSALIVAIGETSRYSRSKLVATEVEAQEARALFETFMNNSPAVTYVKDEDGKFLYTNRTANERFHQPDVVGKTDLDLFPPEMAAEVHTHDLLVLRENKPIEFLEHSIEPDGRHTWLTIKFPLGSRHGKRLLGGKSFDITDRQRAEEALRKAQEELESRVQDRTTELRKANESLGDLSARLMQMQDEERRRLARELHDSVGQLLVAINMNIAKVKGQIHKLDESGARAVMDNTVLVEQISSEIRTISHLLHPPLLDEVGIAFALRWYVDAFSERSKIATTVEIPAEMTRLSTDLEIAIFRIVQECLTNIHRHSGSKTASIQVSEADRKIRVVVQDFGKGIPEDKLTISASGSAGVGFRGMSERIRHLGGTLQVRSNAQEGTLVTATLPLKLAPAANGEPAAY